MKKILRGILVLVFAVEVVSASEIGETVAFSIQMTGEVLDGQIICREQKEFGLCNKEYANSMAGVYNEKPALYIDDNMDGSKPLISNGKAWVLIEGSIEKGDYVTSSKTKGYGMKADRSGIILGIAMEAGSDKKIPVLVGIKSVANAESSGGNLLDSVKQGLVFPNFDALASLRYWLAILICIVSFTIGFIYYGRISKTGIEAMGRNPLASRMIQLNIIFNLILITLIMVGGLALAYAIVVI